MAQPFVIEPTGGTHTHTLVLLHGLGSNGEKFGRALCETGCSSDGRTLPSLLPTARFVFPTAPRRRSSAFGRSMLTQWCDIARLPEPSYRREVQVPGLQDTAQTLLKLLREEQKTVPPAHMVLGGISQGCAAAVSVLLSRDPAVRQLGGFVGLCGYLPFQGEIEAAIAAAQEAEQSDRENEDFFEKDDDDSSQGEVDPATDFVRDLLDLEAAKSSRGTDDPTQKTVPIFLGHGRDDEKVPVHLAEAMAQTLRNGNYVVGLKIYEELGHWFKVPDEIDDIVSFLRDVVGWSIHDWKAIHEKGGTSLPSFIEQERHLSACWSVLASADEIREQLDRLPALSATAVSHLPLYGVTFAVDSSMATTGLGVSDDPKIKEAPVVAQLKASGAILVGKTCSGTNQPSSASAVVSRGVVVFSLDTSAAGGQGDVPADPNVARLQSTQGTIYAHSMADAETVLSAVEEDRLQLVVVGAHLSGLPLNGDLVTRGARLVEATTTAPAYRLHALDPGSGAVRKPGLRRVSSQFDKEEGASIEVEVWSLPTAQLASFIATIPHPLGLGSVELADGIWRLGFICEPVGLHGAQDITVFGGWRAYLKQLKG